jgi:hypothetical protein
LEPARKRRSPLETAKPEEHLYQNLLGKILGVVVIYRQLATTRL